MEFLRDIDGFTASALRELPNRLRAPGSDLLGDIMYFVSLQYLRGPANKQIISMIHETGATDLMEAAFADVKRAAAVMKDYAAASGEDVRSVTPESMVEAVKNKKIKVTATEIPFINTLVTKTEYYAQVFAQLDLKLLISPPQVGFVLSDNPVTLVPHPRFARAAGVYTPGTYVFMPLIRRLCLRLGQPGSGNGPKWVGREEVRLINENTAFNSDRFVMGPSKIQIESVVRRSGSADVNPESRWTTRKSSRENYGEVRELIYQPRHRHYLEL